MPDRINKPLNVVFNKFDKPYHTVAKLSNNKISELFSLSDNMDSFELKNFSAIHKIPLSVSNNQGDNLIHKILKSTDESKNEILKLNLIKYLVSEGANPDQPNSDNNTPLHLACLQQHCNIIYYLLSIGANPNYRDDLGMTPLHYLLNGKIHLCPKSRILKRFIKFPKNYDIKLKKNQKKIKNLIWQYVKLYHNNTLNEFEQIVDNIFNNLDIENATNTFKNDLVKKIANDFNENNNQELFLQQLIEPSISNVEQTVLNNFNNFQKSNKIIMPENDTDSVIVSNENSSIEKIQENLQKINNLLKKIKLVTNIPVSLEKNNKYYRDHIDWKKLTLIGGPRTIDVDTDTNDIKNILNKEKLDEIIKELLNDFDEQSKNTIIDNIERMKKNMIDKNVVATKILNIIIKNNCDDNNIDLDLDSISENYSINCKINIKQLTLISAIANYTTDLKLSINQVAKPIIFIKKLKPQIGGAKVKKKVDLKELREKSKQNSNKNSNDKEDKKLLRAIYDNSGNVKINETETNETNELKKWILNILYDDDKNNKINQEFTRDKLKEIINNFFDDNNFKDYLNREINWYVTNNEIDDTEELIRLIIKYYDNMKQKPLLQYVIDTVALLRIYKNKPEKIIERLNNYYDFSDDDIDDELDSVDNLCYYVLPSKTGYYLQTEEFKIKNNLNEYTVKFTDEEKYKKESKFTIKYKEKEYKNTYFLYRDYDTYYIKFKTKDIYNSNDFDIDVKIMIDDDDANQIDGTIISKNSQELFYKSKLKLSLYLGLNYIGNLLYNYNEINTIYNSQKKNGDNIQMGGANYYTFQHFNDTPEDRNKLYIEKMNTILILRNKIAKETKDLFDKLFQKNQNEEKSSSDDEETKEDTNEEDDNPFETIIKEKYPLLNKLTSLYNFYYNLIDEKSIKNNKLPYDLNSNFSEIVKCLNNINNYNLLNYFINKNYLIKTWFQYELPDNNSLKISDFKLYFNDGGKKNLEGGGKGSVNFIDLFSYFDSLNKLKKDIFHTNTKERNNNLTINEIPNSLLYILNELVEYKILKICRNTVEKKENINFDGIILNDLLEKIFENSNLNENILENSKKILIAKLIEEIIHDYLKNLIRNKSNDKIKKAIGDSNLNSDQLKDFIQKMVPLDNDNFSFSFNKTELNLDDINIVNNLKGNDEDYLINFYNISKNPNPNNKKEKFVIYPNDYTNTFLQKEFYCLEINELALDKMIKKRASFNILDYEENSPIHSLLKNYYSKSLETLKTNEIDFRYEKILNNKISPILFMLNEYKNHTYKFLGVDKDCEKEFKNYDVMNFFTKQQYDEIENMIFANDDFGNNLIRNLDISYILSLFYTQKYLSDKIFENDDLYLILNDYVIDISLSDKSETGFENNLDNIEIFKNDNNLIKNQILNEYINKTGATDEFIKTILNIEFAKTDTEYDNLKANWKKNINNGVYLDGIHKYLKEDNNVEIEKYDIIFLKILEKENETIKLLNKNKNFSNSNLENLRNYYKIYKNISGIAKSYFENEKYLESNNVLKEFKEILVKLTQKILCYNIEMIIRKVLYSYFQPNYEPDQIILNINYILKNEKKTKTEKKKQEGGGDNKSLNSNILDKLYNEVAEKFVMNSVDVFENEDDKDSFNYQSPDEILESFFDSLTENNIFIKKDNYVISILKNQVISYFNTIIQKTIENWLVVMENQLRFIINQERIIDCILKMMK